MAMRVTTNMAMNLYRYNLRNTTARMANSQNVLSGDYRKFSSFGEDPTSAVQAWQIRRAMVDNATYQNNNKDTMNRFNVAFATMGMVTYELVDKAATDATVRGMNDPTAGARVQVGEVLQKTADSVIEAMNGAKYVDHFVFSGTDEMNPPLTWEGGKLYYRGVNVNAGGVKNPAEQPLPDWARDPDSGELIEVNPGGGVPDGMPASSDDLYEQAWIEYYQNRAAGRPAVDPRQEPGEANWGKADEFGVPEGAKNVTSADSAYDRMWAEYYNDQGDLARLERMMDEEQNVDMGMGLEEKDGKLVKGTAFNRALPAIQMLGYGVDENGDPNNVVLVMKRLGEIFADCDYETGDFDKEHPGENTERAQTLRAEANRLMTKLSLGLDNCISQYGGITTKAQYLEENQDRMKLQGDYLNEDRESIENYDPAEAISNFMYDYYCYNAALKVGTQLLSQSLIDYMN